MSDALEMMLTSQRMGGNIHGGASSAPNYLSENFGGMENMKEGKINLSTNMLGFGGKLFAGIVASSLAGFGKTSLADVIKPPAAGLGGKVPSAFSSK